MIKRRNTLYYILILLLFPLLTGCPYESGVPICDKDQAVFDPDLVGVWYNHKADHLSKSIISKLEGNEYRIRHYRESNNKIDINEFNAFITKYREDYFVNVYEPKINFTKGGFLIFKIDKMDANTIRITEIDRYKTPTNLISQEELQQFVQSNITNRSIFNNSMILKKGD